MISRTWADLLPSILEKESSLQIRNGDKLFLLDQVKFMFETLSLSDASPSFIANSVIFELDFVFFRFILLFSFSHRR